MNVNHSTRAAPTPRLVDYHTHEGHRVAVVAPPGRKYLRVVFFDPTQLTVTEVPLEEASFMRDVESRPRIKSTPVASTAKRWLRLVGATQGARAVLEEAAR